MESLLKIHFLIENVVLNDEAHFQHIGYVNMQNCLFRNTDQPEVLRKIPMHSQKHTVLCCLKAVGILGIRTSIKILRIVTSNGKCYRKMISDFVARLALHVVSTIRSLVPQVPSLTTDLLRSEIDEHFISRSGPVNRSSRSCDLNCYCSH